MAVSVTCRGVQWTSGVYEVTSKRLNVYSDPAAKFGAGAYVGHLAAGDLVYVDAVKLAGGYSFPYGRLEGSHHSSLAGGWPCLHDCKGNALVRWVRNLCEACVLTVHAAPDGDTFTLTLTSMSGEEVCACVLDRTDTESDLFAAVANSGEVIDQNFHIILESGVKLAAGRRTTLAQLFMDSALDAGVAQEELI